MTSSKATFDRNVAFSRTIGLLTRAELDLLKTKTVAIAGMGGVGGSHLLTLVRLGVGKFHIADMDTFGIENFNRQVGANMNTLGLAKVDVLKEMALAINPELEIKVFPQGVNANNIKEFFTGVDTYVDSLDVFVPRVRKMVFNFCYENKIPISSAGPLGMSAALVNFIPGRMSVDKYFNWKDSDSDFELTLKFLLGMSPQFPHRAYIVDMSAVNLPEKRGPSMALAIELCAGMMGAEVLKILLNRGKVLSAPHSITYDAYLNKLYHKYVMFGNRNWLQRIKLFVAKRKLSNVNATKD